MRTDGCGLSAKFTGLACAIGLTILVAAGSARSGDDESIALRFQPGEAGSKLAPRYSPKGYRVTLSASQRVAPEGTEPLEALGPHVYSFM